MPVWELGPVPAEGLGGREGAGVGLRRAQAVPPGGDGQAPEGNRRHRRGWHSGAVGEWSAPGGVTKGVRKYRR